LGNTSALIVLAGALSGPRLPVARWLLRGADTNSGGDRNEFSPACRLAAFVGAWCGLAAGGACRLGGAHIRAIRRTPIGA
jgi:hypothetical protein